MKTEIKLYETIIIHLDPFGKNICVLHPSEKFKGSPIKLAKDLFGDRCYAVKFH